MKGPSIKYLRSKREGGGQGKSVYLLFVLFKGIQGAGGVKITKFERSYFMDGPEGVQCPQGIYLSYLPRKTNLFYLGAAYSYSDMIYQY